jgi:hypothetical protein
MALLCRADSGPCAPSILAVWVELGSMSGVTCGSEAQPDRPAIIAAGTTIDTRSQMDHFNGLQQTTLTAFS